MVESKYRYCKLDGEEFHGSEREKHVKEAHGADMNLKKPSEWFLESPPVEEEKEKYRKELLPTGNEKACMKKPPNDRSIHKYYVEELARAFEAQGCKVIIEGKTPESATPRGWRAPDIFVLKDLKLVKVIEVVVSRTAEYEKTGISAYNKCQKIRNYYNPPEIIVFQPTDFLDKKYLQTKKDFHKRKFHLDEDPTSFKDIDRLYAEKWKSEGLNVVFWNEENLKQLWKGNTK